MMRTMMAATVATMIAIAALPGLAAPAAAGPVLDTPVRDEWWTAGRAALAQRLAVVNRPKRAKNVILMIGDGMGVATVTAGRIFDGQNPGAGKPRRNGEENVLSFETLPHVALVKTYNSNAQVPDSAGTASAMNTGVKTRIGVINFGAEQRAAACRTPDRLPRTVAEMARGQGMAVGVVTTTRITHATPAAVYGHVPDRDWEGADDAFPKADRARGCADLARQLVEFPQGIEVALGGGAERFRPRGSAPGVKASRDDGRDLVAEWQQRYPAGRFAGDAGALRAIDPGVRGPVLGLFSNGHMSFETDRNPAVEPGLSEMARFAVAKLHASRGARRNRGYYLMIEGGRIDHAHHATNPYRALSETQEFARAVAAVLASVDLDETLVLVTADHSHVMTIAGYPRRGNDILGAIIDQDEGEAAGTPGAGTPARDAGGRVMTTLSYANGPAAVPGLDPKLPPTDRNYLSSKLYTTPDESHGGEDVALFAAGPRAHLVGGVIEQNVIFHIIAEALGWK